MVRTQTIDSKYCDCSSTAETFHLKVFRKAILTAEIAENLSDPAGGAYSDPPSLLSGGEGLGAPLHELLASPIFGHLGLKGPP